MFCGLPLTNFFAYYSVIFNIMIDAECILPLSIAAASYDWHGSEESLVQPGVMIILFIL